ncbi:uncharacterized protein [Euphorbia lathyris]|uniref:uncharacterized protein n=1 Tax=Euphorbia lathyris TaxID=212925 RepID=UPI0033140300
MGLIDYLDTILVPFSFLLMLGYHAYLWHCFKHKPSQTTIGIDALRRKNWLSSLKEGNDKKSILVIQSLRNAQMGTIFTASIAILINLSLAALTNNIYKASHLLNSSAYFGIQTGKIDALKFGSGCVFLLVSFLCSSMGLGCMIDANFLLNVPSIELGFSSSYAENVFERGFLLSLIGNRVLCVTFPLVVWLLGPLPVALSSMALVRALYELDFSVKCNDKI